MPKPSSPSNQLSAILASPSAGLKLTNETIAKYGLEPTFRGTVENPTVTVKGNSHPCGDEIEFQILFKMGKFQPYIADIAHNGHACCLTTAVADVLCWNLVDRGLDRLISISRSDVIDPGLEVKTNREGCIRLPLDLIRQLYENAKALRPEGTGVDNPAKLNQVHD